MKSCGHRYGITRSGCPPCLAAYVRKWRKLNPPSADELHKRRVRALAHAALKRGEIVRQDCQRCGDPNSQMCIEDYSKPLEIKWLCRQCRTVLRTMQWRQRSDPSYFISFSLDKNMKLL